MLPDGTTVQCRVRHEYHDIIMILRVVASDRVGRYPVFIGAIMLELVTPAFFSFFDLAVMKGNRVLVFALACAMGFGARRANIMVKTMAGDLFDGADTAPALASTGRHHRFHGRLIVPARPERVAAHQVEGVHDTHGVLAALGDGRRAARAAGQGQGEARGQRSRVSAAADGRPAACGGRPALCAVRSRRYQVLDAGHGITVGGSWRNALRTGARNNETHSLHNFT